MRWSYAAPASIMIALAVPTATRAEDPARPGMCAAHERITNGPAVLWPSYGTGPNKASAGTGAYRGNPGASAAGGLTVYIMHDKIYHSTGPLGFAHPVQDCAAVMTLGEIRELMSPRIQELSQGP
ncbi:MAG TPA: hypothetical protein VMI34_09810 [Candidatus Bathyarchaeia archaeon]|nr:hypothetical protein [Candidatus Bathyarchaeia archaeon]